SSFQFRVEKLDGDQIEEFIQCCANRGVELKWFGGKEPHGFTSRYDSWRYLDNKQYLPNTLRILSTTFDLRIPLTFEVEDMIVIGEVINDVVAQILGQAN
ncbi:MAG: aminotransferase, partial [Gammaproteobacteria bacterium]|nr:aminotransferase [Gammaproteobacteria bacterium]